MDNTGNQNPQENTLYAAGNTPPPQNPVLRAQPGAASQPPGGSFSNAGGELEEDTSPLKKILIIGGALLVFLFIFFLIFQVVMRFIPQKSGKITLTYWGLWEDEAIFKPVFDDFTRLHPNITIKYEKQDIKGLGKYVDRIRTRISNGSGDVPDLFRFHVSWGPELQGALLPMSTDVVSSTGLDSKFYQIADPLGKSTKIYYGVPLEIDDLCLFVNSDLMKDTQVPTTWNDFVETAKRLTVRDASGTAQMGAALGTFDNVSHASDIISLLLIQNGADLTDLGGANRQSTITALQYYTDFAVGFNPDSQVKDNVWDDTMPNSTLAFAQGKVAMYFGYSWDLLEIKAVNPNLNFSIHPVPHVAGGKKLTVASFWEEGISSKTKHPKEAYELLKFMAQKESLEKIFENQSKSRGVGVPYPRSDLADKLKSDELLYPFVDQLKNAAVYSTPFSADTYDGDDAMNFALDTYLGNTVRSIDNGTSVDSAVDQTLAPGAKQVLGNYGY